MSADFSALYQIFKIKGLRLAWSQPRFQIEYTTHFYELSLKIKTSSHLYLISKWLCPVMPKIVVSVAAYITAFRIPF